ncbi:hypothetical protein STCU_06903 [Strigomonas culicis]|uniref:Uncharacterized protein n=1 Tax=Strigomonas culicis TaxID=28005 RepID=S9U857_9TRYP|nr:hypothetical protein STCU_06903 [Strigomonas culicis]|eukprot:EPY24989.1 hypothetical protein STCU_06903 [Strigomonas culicis]
MDFSSLSSGTYSSSSSSSSSSFVRAERRLVLLRLEHGGALVDGLDDGAAAARDALTQLPVPLLHLREPRGRLVVHVLRGLLLLGDAGERGGVARAAAHRHRHRDLLPAERAALGVEAAPALPLAVRRRGPHVLHQRPLDGQERHREARAARAARRLRRLVGDGLGAAVQDDHRAVLRAGPHGVLHLPHRHDGRALRLHRHGARHRREVPHPYDAVVAAGPQLGGVLHRQRAQHGLLRVEDRDAGGGGRRRGVPHAHRAVVAAGGDARGARLRVLVRDEAAHRVGVAGQHALVMVVLRVPLVHLPVRAAGVHVAAGLHERVHRGGVLRRLEDLPHRVEVEDADGAVGVAGPHTPARLQQHERRAAAERVDAPNLVAERRHAHSDGAVRLAGPGRAVEAERDAARVAREAARHANAVARDLVVLHERAEALGGVERARLLLGPAPAAGLLTDGLPPGALRRGDRGVVETVEVHSDGGDGDGDRDVLRLCVVLQVGWRSKPINKIITMIKKKKCCSCCSNGSELRMNGSVRREAVIYNTHMCVYSHIISLH